MKKSEVITNLYVVLNSNVTESVITHKGNIIKDNQRKPVVKVKIFISVQLYYIVDLFICIYMENDNQNT